MGVKELIFFPFFIKGKILFYEFYKISFNTHFIFNTDFLSDFFSAFMLILANLQVNSEFECVLTSEQIIEEMSAQQLREDKASTEISFDKEEWELGVFFAT